jgi:hypothetical protein
MAAPEAAIKSQTKFAEAIPKAGSIADLKPYLNEDDITNMTAGPGVKPPTPNKATKANHSSKDIRLVNY